MFNCCAWRCALPRMCVFPGVFGGRPLTHNPLVGGSNPSGPTCFKRFVTQRQGRSYPESYPRWCGHPKAPLPWWHPNWHLDPHRRTLSGNTGLEKTDPIGSEKGMNLNCPHCGQVLDCPDELLEKSVTCFNCQKSFITEIPDDQKESPILKRVIVLLLLAVGILIAAPKIYMSYCDIFLRPETERILEELEESMLEKGLGGSSQPPSPSVVQLWLEESMLEKGLGGLPGSSHAPSAGTRRDAREEILQATMPEEIPYENAKYGFSIVFPEGWEISPGASGGTIVKSVYRDDQGKFAMLTISAEAEKEVSWQRAYRQPGELIFQKILEEWPGIQSELLDSGRSHIGPEASFWLMYETTEPLDLAGVYIQHHIYVGKSSYQITGFSNDRSWVVANEWQKQKPKMLEIWEAIDSLRFTVPAKLGKLQ